MLKNIPAAEAFGRDTMANRQAAEVQSGTRFEFGANWNLFLKDLNEERIQFAERSLQQMLARTTLEGSRFLDVGSGSGLFSLAARRLGATVHSFDYDPQSVQCTAELKRRYFHDDDRWTIETGSILDAEYVARLGQWDLVYSWGVLHHTGQLSLALEHAGRLVTPRGLLYIAIYNDQGRGSRRWLQIKQVYNRLPRAMRWIILLPALVRLWGPTMFRDLLRGRPRETWRNYARQSVRGMSAWRDVVDWVGGLPFEVARPEAIFNFYHNRGFQLEQLKTCGGGLGCNEFVFQSTAAVSVP